MDIPLDIKQDSNREPTIIIQAPLLATTQIQFSLKPRNPTEALLQCQTLLNQLQTQFTTSSNSSTNHIVGTLSNSYWVIDSGAFTHICCSKEFLTDIQPCSASISLPNQNTYQVKSIGTVKLSDTLVLKNVLYMPEFSFNSLFVSAITKGSSFSVQFFTDTCII